VSVSVVYVLEAVEVEVEDRDRLALAALPVERQDQAILEDAAVRQPGEVVMGRSMRKRGLGLLVLADVLHLREQVRRGAIGAADDRRAEADPDHAAVGVDVALLGLEPVPDAVDHLLQCLDVVGKVVGMGDVGKAHADELVDRIAGQVREGAVGAHPAALRADDRHADRSVVEGAAEALVGLVQCLLGAASLADVVHEGVEAKSVGGLQGREAQLDREPDSIAV